MTDEIKKVSIEDPDYPEILKSIDNPPDTLYVMGRLKRRENGIAIVGSRRCTSYGKEVTLHIGRELAENGLTIISGFAPGIDTMAHYSAIEVHGRTIAVLGTGLDKNSIYPKSNIGLIKKILENGGAIISEFPPGTHGAKYTFPKRNRIIAGLSCGVLVVEARMKSGALITAEHAFSQKKPVFAIPGQIYSQTSKGCHYLIKMGAKLVDGAGDILKELGIEYKTKMELIEGGGEENLILNVLSEGALNIEKIIEKTGLSAQRIASQLAILEIKGKVKKLDGNIYAISNR